MHYSKLQCIISEYRRVEYSRVQNGEVHYYTVKYSTLYNRGELITSVHKDQWSRGRVTKQGAETTIDPTELTLLNGAQHGEVY